jgi:hypothetical protein
MFLLRVLPDLRASAVILFKWAAKSGDYLGILFCGLIHLFAADVLGFVGSGGLLRAAGGRLGVDLWGIGHSFGGSDF